jgi:polysaccharide export outer membrane protein
VVTVLGEAEFAGTRLVGTQGTIYLPLIGTLEVAGKTLAEVRAAVVTSLREVIREPYVTVALDEVNCKRRVYITGRVERLGSQMLPLGATIVDAVVAAGILEDTDLANVQLSRTDGKNIRFDLSGLRTGTAVTVATLMQWDDRVFIPRVEAFVTVVGRVQKPGSYLLPPGRKMRVLDLMNQVGGGMVEGAEFRTALLIREGQTGPDTIDLVKLLKQGDLAQNYELRANDVLVIPETDRITVAGEVLQPVTFYTPGKTTVLEALSRVGGFTPMAGLRQARVSHADGSSAPVDLDALWRRGELAQNLELSPGDVLMVPRADPEEVLITGAVAKPGAYDLRDVKDRSLVRAISLVGTMPVADLTRVSIFRGDAPVVCNLRQALETGDKQNNPALQAGDVVFVPDSERVLVIGAFHRPGHQAYDPKFTLMDYVGQAGGVASGYANQGALVRTKPDGTTEMIRLDLSRIQLGVLPEPVKVKPGDIIYVPVREAKVSIWDKLRDFIVTIGAIRSLWLR